MPGSFLGEARLAAIGFAAALAYHYRAAMSPVRRILLYRSNFSASAGRKTPRLRAH